VAGHGNMLNENYEYDFQPVKLERGSRKIYKSGEGVLLSRINKKRGAGWELIQIIYPKIGLRLPRNSQPQEIKIDEAIVVFRRRKK